MEKLCQGWGNNESDGCELKDEISRIDDFYRAVEKRLAGLSTQIDISSGHIETVHAGQQFIQHLQDTRWGGGIVARVVQARDTLLPWQGYAMSESHEIKQLIERYPMEQERLIHMFDRVEGEQARLGEEDIFF